jgi:hypothetical protein
MRLYAAAAGLDFGQFGHAARVPTNRATKKPAGAAHRQASWE